jgi:hypothetical protein
MEVWVAASSGAIAGLISGVIGSLIEPWVQWAIEKRRNRQNYRRDLIRGAREQLDNCQDIREFANTAAYSSIKLHLRAEVQRSVEDPTLAVYGGTPGPGGYRPGHRGGGSPNRHRLLDDIARIEKEWGLV